MKVKVLHFKFAKLVSLPLLAAACCYSVNYFLSCCGYIEHYIFSLSTKKSRLEERLL